jgi:cell division protein FtsQ
MEAGERRRSGLTTRPRLAVGLVSGVLVLLLGLPLLLAFGPVFPVRTIAVSGTSGALAKQVRSALAGELGRPVALVDDHDVAAALAAVPAVERFTLVRRPPSTLEVAVVPRTPVVQQRTAAGWAVLDAARVTIQVDQARIAGLPVLTIRAGAARPALAYAAAVSALRALQGADPAVTAVRTTSADDVVLTLRSGVSVQWGGAEDGAAKAEALRAALVRAADGATEIDVSSPGVVLTR